MKLRKKYYGAKNQIVIIIIFFAGMWVNYFLLAPIIESEETARITGDLDRYVSYFTELSRVEKLSTCKVDSLRRITPDPFGGRFVVATVDGDVIFDSVEGTGAIRSRLQDTYGDLPVGLIDKAIADSSAFSFVDFEDSEWLMYYAHIDVASDTIYFYSADYLVAGSDMVKALYVLLILMIVGGLIIIFVCFWNVQKLTEKVLHEASENQELETASSIQKALLPREDRHLMQLDINARLVPARMVGGDLYYYMLQDGVLYFCIGDVSGKGVPASLTMGCAVTLFRSLVQSRLSPSEIAAGLNRELCYHNDTDIFITAFIGAIRVYDGRMRYCNAGHDLPVFWSGDESDELHFFKTSCNLPLGFDESSKYVEDEITIPRNSMFFLYTDGVTEARGADSSFFGRERLLSLLSTMRNSNAMEINDVVLKAVSEFRGKAEQSDDITLLTFRNIVRSKNLKIDNDVKSLRKLSPFMEELFKECTMDNKTRMRVRSAIDEALTNCVRYAYPASKGTIELSAVIYDGFLVFTIRDKGIPFNPLTFEKAPSEDIKVGGLGIQMIKACFDELSYRRIDDENILKLKKSL